MGWLGKVLGLDNPMRSGGQYEGVDRGNFDLPGYDDQQGRLNDYLSQVDSRGPSSFRGDQEQLAGLLMRRAQGQDSLAEQQLRAGADMSNRQQQSFVAGARPSNAAMAMRMGSQNQANTMMGLSGAAAQARAQEAQQAALGLGGLLGQARGADMQQIAMDDAARAGLLGQSLEAAGMQQQGGMGYEQNRTQRYGAALGVPTKREAIIGGLAGLATGLASGGGG